MPQEETNVVEKTAPETTGQTSSPQVEAQPTEVQTTSQVATDSRGSDVESSMSEEQRRAFQEMRLENKRLKEETEARKRTESAFAAFRQQPQVTPGDISLESFRDSLTGEYNLQAYDQAMRTEIQRAQQIALQAAQSVEEKLDEREARLKHPELFADPDIEQEIADRWFASKMRGENVSISEFTDRYAKRFQKVVSKAEKSGAEKALEQVTPKEQAALSAAGVNPGSARAESARADQDTLVRLSRKGSEEAIAERLKGVSWANR